MSETSRTEAFTDGVPAIAVTLLILDLRVPVRETLGGAGLGFRRALARDAAYVTSFLIVGIIWVDHHGVYELVPQPPAAADDGRPDSGQDLADVGVPAGRRRRRAYRGGAGQTVSVIVEATDGGRVTPTAATGCCSPLSHRARSGNPQDGDASLRNIDRPSWRRSWASCSPW